MPPPIDHSDDVADKPNLTPLIDLVFLLLVFLILTTQFDDPEDILWQLLPREGQATTTSEPIVLPEAIDIVLLPGDARPGSSTLELDALAASRAPTAIPSVRVRIDGEELLIAADEDPQRRLDRLHEFIAAALAERELDGQARGEQDRIVIHGFSGLPYGYVLGAYDVVRAYEIGLAGRPDFDLARGIQLEREVAFAPPRLRAYREHERGHELRELLAIR